MGLLKNSGQTEPGLVFPGKAGYSVWSKGRM